MGPKKDNDSKVKRKMTRITIEVKKEIIAKHENGVRVSDLAIQFGVAKSTICHHHQVLLLLVEHRASMKSFQLIRSTAIPLTSFHDFLVPLISSSIVLHHVLFGLPLLLYP
jgi:DNA-binding IclR family transcriptional regulator